ncbi:hypothetical protein EA462_08150 [Natrarchaeobius halalkaliphilus]|uniref:Uncharacterized protein n=1 Tax=Natrarchaeobius halalkaliphilus TaxID=1679091 RepID=A0A3N6NYN6_9EURY|nr:hypothetical protein [Natrarchaeobius halalkaliphilus]RQG89969.1 hypothetical protein EA462_08150 [Natrarchaeobius halalkaliphilus]
MKLTRSLVTAEARQYREQEPLFVVERENLKTLPGALESGEYGRRDAAWIVRWYYRRFLGEYPDEARRNAEERFWETDFDAVRTAISGAIDAPDAAVAVDRLTDLEAVDVPVASAFLMFIDPEAYVVVGPREWSVLSTTGELSEPYPDPPSVAQYQRYLEQCQSLADELDCDLETLYRALWRLSD